VRVLHVIKGLGPGGAERLLVSLAGARADDVELVVAYVLPHKDHLVAPLEAAGVSVHLVAGRWGLLDARWPVRLLALVRRLRPDVVHLHSPAVTAIATPLLRLLPRRPVIVTTEHNVWGSFTRTTRTANALGSTLADERLAVSEEVRASAGRHAEHLQVVVQGIPVDELAGRRGERAEARAALGIEDRDVLVVTVANFREKKDYPTLLAAAARCADEPSLRFVAIGQGPLESELQALRASLGLGDRFRFAGYHPDPPAVLAGADLFALTSRHEGLPISLLEAMALGVTPVVSAVGGIPEVVTDGRDGELLAPGDPQAFADAFRRLANDPARRAALGAAAAVRAADFDIAHTQRQLEALYERLMADR
jgi:glycosyltransferase involved in cell wall biosynthesis